MSRRFDSFWRFSFTSTGTWANTGSSPPPRACHSSSAFGVLGRCSSPRMTWVMPMSMSSTTLASRNIGGAVAPLDDEVLDGAVLERRRAADEVDDVGRALPRGAEPQRTALARARGPRSRQNPS